MAAHKQRVPSPHPISSMVLPRKSIFRKTWRQKRGKSKLRFRQTIVGSTVRSLSRDWIPGSELTTSDVADIDRLLFRKDLVEAEASIQLLSHQLWMSELPLFVA